MNTRIAITTCLSVFTIAAIAMPAFAYKSTTPMVNKAKAQSVVATKLPKKSKKISKISLNRKTTAVISCGKK